MPEYFSESTSSHFYQYLTGWIKADFIDMLDEDVISTNRQSLNWDHPEMTKFRSYISGLISDVGHDWRKKRAEKKDGDLKQAIGIDREAWLSTLPKGVKESVDIIVKKMGTNEEISETFAPVIKALYDIVPEYPLLHWRHLHPSIKSGVYEYYKNGQYAHAADQGTKIYAQRVRKISKQDKDGTNLCSVYTFEYDQKTNKLIRPPLVSVNDLSTESLRNIQNGQSELTRGLMTGFRNPVNHAPVSSVVPAIITELDCLNILSLVSYLSTKLDYSDMHI